MYPSGEEYVNAVRNINACVIDPAFRGGQPRKKGFLIEQYAGGYSRVFPINVGLKTLALRGFTSDVQNARHRYQILSSTINHLQLDYFVDFEYVEKGIRIKGKEHPIIRMEWFDGVTLKIFLQNNHSNAQMMRQTAHIFLDMVKSLHAHQISHGDLQEENILIKINGNTIEMKLIDYDSVFVPQLKTFPQQIVGKPNFQHPIRIQQISKKVCDGEKLDYFSELVIYICFIALAEKPSLWKRYQIDQVEGLLFDPKDFLNPKQSSIFKDLKKISPEIHHLCTVLENFCLERHLGQLIPLEDIVNQAVPQLLQQTANHNKSNKNFMVISFVLMIIVLGFCSYMFSDRIADQLSSIMPKRNEPIAQSADKTVPSENNLTNLSSEPTPTVYESGKNKIEQSDTSPDKMYPKPIAQRTIPKPPTVSKKDISISNEIPFSVIYALPEHAHPFIPKKIILKQEKRSNGHMNAFHEPQKISKSASHFETQDQEEQHHTLQPEIRLLKPGTVIYTRNHHRNIMIHEQIYVTMISTQKDRTKATVQFEAFARGFSIDGKNVHINHGNNLFARPEQDIIGTMLIDHTFPIIKKQTIKDYQWYLIEIKGVVYF